MGRPARTPLKTLALLAAAKRTGPAIATICDHIHRHDGAAGVRRILGVLALAKSNVASRPGTATWSKYASRSGPYCTRHSRTRRCIVRSCPG